jgi:Asp-tRNA(Asn)/Glu-tRNA(Gln) amidotransferase A subunit family amidase
MHRLLPRDGVLAHSDTLDHVGLLAPGVHDLVPLLAALGAPPSAPPGRARIAWVADWDVPAATDIEDALRRAARMFGAAGAEIAQLEAPIGIEAARQLVRSIGLPESVAHHRALLAAPADALSQRVRGWLSPGIGLDPAIRMAALEARAALAASVDAMLARCDAILCVGHLQLLPDAADERACIAYCLASPNCVFNLTGHPALSVPAGLDRSGRPIGLQLVGRHGADLALLALATAIELPALPAGAMRAAQ